MNGQVIKNVFTIGRKITPLFIFMIPRIFNTKYDSIQYQWEKILQVAKVVF